MKNSPPKPPEHLSAEARRWWRRLHDEFDLGDTPARLLLQTALEAFDRMREAQGILATDGQVVRDRFDQRKAHPATVTERDARAQFLAALRQLDLEIGDDDGDPALPVRSPRRGRR